MRKRLSLSTTLLAFGAGSLLAAACGDNVTPAGVPDADTTPPPDAEPPPDSEPPPTFSGTVTVLEASVFGAPQVGQGLQVAASFQSSANAVAPVLDTAPGSPIGCKVFEFTAAQAANPGLNEGFITVTIDNDTVTAGVQGPATPTCAFGPTGYFCPQTGQFDAAGVPQAMALGGTISATGNAGQILLTDADGPGGVGVGAFQNFTQTDGRYVSFVGIANALIPDGTALPMVGKVSDSSIVLVHPAAPMAFTAIAIPAGGLHLVVGGAGPIPAIFGDPTAPAATGMLLDGADVQVNFTAGGAMNVPTGQTDFDPPAGPGNDFAIAAAAQAAFGNLPLAGDAAFSVSCDAASDCGAGTGDGVVLNIVTTDAPLTGLSGLAMPLPVTKRVQIRCAALGSSSVSVPANVAAYLRQTVTGATRIQTTFIRGELNAHPMNADILVVAGHAITTFKTVTQCNDGVDNGDTDTTIDTADTGCTLPTPSSDPSEEPQCADGLDNDGAGGIDLADTDCADASDDSE